MERVHFYKPYLRAATLLLPLLGVSLYSTNPIESMFSNVRYCEKNIKRYRKKGTMIQRWLAAVLLHAEQKFRALKRNIHIKTILQIIKDEQKNNIKKAA